MRLSQSVRDYGFAVAEVACATLLCFAIFPHLERTNLVMVYLLGTLAVAARGLRGPAALSSLLSVLAFDFFFVPPRFRFGVSDVQYVFTFAVMFTVAMIISHLTVRLREEAEAAREGERRTAWLMEKAKKAEIAAETEHLRSALLSSVSHDFRTPLAAIVGSAEALQAKASILKEPAAQELLENIQTEGQRLSHLVENLLESTRLESGTVQIRKELYPLEEIVGSALERVSKSMADHELAVHIPEDLAPVPLDALLVEQVLINLLENAVRYSPPHGPLTIAVQTVPEGVQISVADVGPGLQESEMEKVFDKFYRGETSKGSGLGLAICRAIVNAHGGRIWVENGAGGGAIFRFTLPSAKSA